MKFSYRISHAAELIPDNSAAREIISDNFQNINFYHVVPDLITGIAVFFTGITISGLVYTFFIQNPVLKLEHILNSLTIMLATTEVLFGIIQIMIPCFRKNPYY